MSEGKYPTAKNERSSETARKPDFNRHAPMPIAHRQPKARWGKMRRDKANNTLCTVPVKTGKAKAKGGKIRAKADVRAFSGLPLCPPKSFVTNATAVPMRQILACKNDPAMASTAVLARGAAVNLMDNHCLIVLAERISVGTRDTQSQSHWPMFQPWPASLAR